MEVFNKFYFSVNKTVSQLSGAVMGNNVTREYEVVEHVTNAGIGLFWKVYSGYKKSTKQEVSIFVFEKKKLDNWSKVDRDIMVETLKRGVQQLTKIKHPHILTMQHPLEESRDSLAFATEPVFECLSNLLGNTSEKKMYDIEIRHGLLQLIDGLMFLHSDAKIIHNNICPCSIMINRQRCWKIFGFDFCVANSFSTDGITDWPCYENSLVKPCFDYCPPEIVLNGKISTDRDLFSLGVLIYAVYFGEPIKKFGGDYNAFRSYMIEFSQRTYPLLHPSTIHTELNENIKRLLHPSPHLRTKLNELNQISFFQDVRVKTLNYLNSLYQWDNRQKSKFFKGLTKIIPTLPHQVNIYSVLPYLVKEFINSAMVPFVLPNVLLIADMGTQNEFFDHIFPHLKLIFKQKEPIQILLILMQKLDVLLKLIPPDEIKHHVLPLLYKSLDCDIPQIQELCLGALPTASTLIDCNAMNNFLIPRIKKMCLNSKSVSVKVNCLVSIGKLLEKLDKWLVLNDILPFLNKIESREPAVIMAIIGIYRIVMTNPKLGITKEVIAQKCIPFLMPLCVENCLTVNQFTLLITLIKEMVKRVEKEQGEKLEQLKTVEYIHGLSNEINGKSARGNDVLSSQNNLQLSNQYPTDERCLTSTKTLKTKTKSNQEISQFMLGENSNLSSVASNITKQNPTLAPNSIMLFNDLSIDSINLWNSSSSQIYNHHQLSSVQHSTLDEVNPFVIQNHKKIPSGNYIYPTAPSRNNLVPANVLSYSKTISINPTESSKPCTLSQQEILTFLN